MQSNSSSIEAEGTQGIIPEKMVNDLLITLLICAVAPLYIYIKKRISKPVRAYEITHLLHKYFIYYRYLSQKNKMIFEARVFRFIKEKWDIPRNFREVPSGTKILITAMGVQITFGLLDITLRHLKGVIIYLDTYFRAYAAHSEQEFFAVVAEIFFERHPKPSGNICYPGSFT